MYDRVYFLQDLSFIPFNTLYMYINQNVLTLCGMELFNKFNLLLKSSKNKCLMDVFKAMVDLHITCEGPDLLQIRLYFITL